jgi:hypothetical protein
MNPSKEEALSQLNKWKTASARLFFHSSSMHGLTTRCVGTLQHVSSSEVSFGIDEIDGRDLLFTVNLHEANFKWVDNRDDWQFFAPGRKKTAFGLVLELDLKPGGRILFAELFSSAVEM